MEILRDRAWKYLVDVPVDLSDAYSEIFSNAVGIHSESLGYGSWHLLRLLCMARYRVHSSNWQLSILRLRVYSRSGVTVMEIRDKVWILGMDWTLLIVYMYFWVLLFWVYIEEVVSPLWKREGNWSRDVSRNCLWDRFLIVSQSLVRVPEVFAKNNSAHFPLVSKVANGNI